MRESLRVMIDGPQENDTKGVRGCYLPCLVSVGVCLQESLPVGFLPLLLAPPTEISRLSQLLENSSLSELRSKSLYQTPY